MSYWQNKEIANWKGHMMCVDAGIIWLLSCLVRNTLENLNFEDFWSSSTGGLEILRFAVSIDPFMLRFAGLPWQMPTGLTAP